MCFGCLTLYHIITPFDPLNYHVPVVENIMENRVFAPKEQMLHFPKYFQKLNFVLNFFNVV